MNGWLANAHGYTWSQFSLQMTSTVSYDVILNGCYLIKEEQCTKLSNGLNAVSD